LPWEDGMKGATGRGEIKRASSRGLEEESREREESIGEEEENEATFNPGMI